MDRTNITILRGWQSRHYVSPSSSPSSLWWQRSLGGLLAHSLALLSDAGHALTDIFALGLASGVSSTMTRKGDVRQGIKIELATIVWMVIEASVAITVGFATHSVSLQGFLSVILTILLSHSVNRRSMQL